MPECLIRILIKVLQHQPLPNSTCTHSVIDWKRCRLSTYSRQVYTHYSVPYNLPDAISKALINILEEKYNVKYVPGCIK